MRSFIAILLFAILTKLNLFSHASHLRSGRILKKDHKTNGNAKNKPNGMFAVLTNVAPSSSPSQAPSQTPSRAPVLSEEPVYGFIEGDYSIPAPDIMPPYEGGDFGETPPTDVFSGTDVVMDGEEWIPCGGDAFIRNSFVLREWPECVGMTVSDCEKFIVKSIDTANDVPVTFAEVAEGSFYITNHDDCRVRIFYKESEDGGEPIVVSPQPARG